MFDFNSFELQDNPLENLNLAFDVAEKHLNIPRMLDAEGNHCRSGCNLATRSHVRMMSVLKQSICFVCL